MSSYDKRKIIVGRERERERVREGGGGRGGGRDRLDVLFSILILKNMKHLDEML